MKKAKKTVKKTVRKAKAPKKATKRAGKSPAERLGLERMVLTKKNCRDRAKTLRAQVEKGKFKGELSALARRWANWYSAKANAL